MILRKSDRPRRKLMRVTSLVAPIVGALLALGFMTAPAANAAIATEGKVGAAELAESEWLNKEEKKIEDIANDFNLNTNGPATEDIKNQLRDAERKAEAAAQERDQAAQAVEDADRDAASRFE